MKSFFIVVAIFILGGCTQPNLQKSQQNIKIEGCWSQKSITKNKDASVDELILKKDGRFTLTFLPFERYKDYWGKYNYDAKSKKLSFYIEGSNIDTKRLDLDGKVVFEDNNSIILKGFFLGKPSYAKSKPPKEYHFIRCKQR